jgi:thymidine kinase
MIEKEGKLELIAGTMFGGKSTELIRRVTRYEIVGRKVQVFGPSIDTRYAKNSITSHDKLQREAQYVNSAQELENKLAPGIQVIGIDEVQFFDSDIVELCERYANKGKVVIVAGLLKDFKDSYFSFKDGKKDMSDLVQAADMTTFLAAMCNAQNGNGEICGRDATRVQRYIDGQVAPLDSPVVQVGGTESYAPRCRRHYQFYHD